jgi:hypothetical protein
MLRVHALLALTALVACAGGRSIDPPAAAGSYSPRLTRLDDRIVLSWVEPDASGVPALRFALRSDSSWSEARTAASDAHLSPDRVDVTSVVPLRGGGFAAHWTVSRDGAPDARDVLVSVSTDGGSSWSKPLRPNRDDTETEHGMATLLPGEGIGAFGMCWLDGRAGARSDYGEGGTSLYWADWNGEGFGPELLLDARVCDCCKTSAARGPSGPVVAYRDRADAERRDIAVVSRAETSWTAPQPVHVDGWTITACPTNGPSIATRGDRAAVAWFTGAKGTPSVWVALSADGGKTLDAPTRIDGGAPVGRVEATMLTDGSTALVWLERKRKEAEVRVRRIAADGVLTPAVVVATTSPARASGYPSIVAASERDVLVAWTETGSTSRVRASLVTLP